MILYATYSGKRSLHTPMQYVRLIYGPLTSGPSSPTRPNNAENLGLRGDGAWIVGGEEL